MEATLTGPKPKGKGEGDQPDTQGRLKGEEREEGASHSKRRPKQIARKKKKRDGVVQRDAPHDGCTEKKTRAPLGGRKGKERKSFARTVYTNSMRGEKKVQFAKINGGKTASGELRGCFEGTGGQIQKG